MKKKSLFILLLTAVLMLSGCSSLVLRDSAVDAAQTILSVNGEHITKQRFANLYNYNLYNEQQYAQMMAQFGLSDGSVDTAAVLQSTAESFVNTLSTQQKAAELGLDQFSDAESADMDAEAQAQYEEDLQSVKEIYFADSEPTDEELAAVASNQGVTLSSTRNSVELSRINDRLKEYAAQDVTVDDAMLQAALDKKIESLKSRFETNANALNTAVNAGDVLYYTPAGYRTIRVIDSAEDTAEADLQALAGRIAQGEALDSLGVEVTQYTVREGTTAPNPDLVTAAMALTEKGSVTEVIQTTTGYAIAEYTDDVAENTMTLADARGSLYDETLENARNDAYTAAMNEWINAADIQLYLDRLN
ncbi:MAG: hypothetical protein IJ157_14245 [Clostridia bacterium]|nr:hypothetical protein [Clostridia bacterium]